jgi:hypothetical protein
VRVTSPAGLSDDVFEDRRSNPPPEMRIGRAHGFDFAGSRPELLQCTEAKKLFALP